MKKIIFTSILSLSIFCCFGQSYLGTIIKVVNLRSGPGIEYEILKSLKRDDKIFITNLLTENEFYNVIDIKTNKEGYIKRSFFKVVEKVKENEPGLFTPIGRSITDSPEIEIYNNTNRPLMLKLNNEVYHFSAKQTKNISLVPGKYSYRASAPNVRPNIGTEEIQDKTSYKWQFYIITR